MNKMETENYKFFQHKECEFFPCHETDKPEDFNCLFCYCPLFCLGDKCGGNFEYTENGIKDCSNCRIPHSKNAFDYIIGKSKDLMELAKKNRG